MPTLYVRNVPDELHDRIRRRARAQNRSVGAEVIALLDRALAGTERTQGDVLADIRRRRAFHPAEAGAPGSATLLREDRVR